MSSKKMASHEACDHPATSAARDRCRMQDDEYRERRRERLREYQTSPKYRAHRRAHYREVSL